MVLRYKLSESIDFAYTPITFCGRPFRVFLLSNFHRLSSALQPPTLSNDDLKQILQLILSLEYVKSESSTERVGFRLFRFRSPLLTESLMISFPDVTKMFQFT